MKHIMNMNIEPHGTCFPGFLENLFLQDSDSQSFALYRDFQSWLPSPRVSRIVKISLTSPFDSNVPTRADSSVPLIHRDPSDLGSMTRFLFRLLKVFLLAS